MSKDLNSPALIQSFLTNWPAYVLCLSPISIHWLVCGWRRKALLMSFLHAFTEKLPLIGSCSCGRFLPLPVGQSMLRIAPFAPRLILLFDSGLPQV